MSTIGIEKNPWWSPSPKQAKEMRTQWEAKFDRRAQSGSLERFRQWVVGLQYHPRPSVGFGGPKETPFANTIDVSETDPALIAAQILGSPTGRPEDLSVDGLRRAIAGMGA